MDDVTQVVTVGLKSTTVLIRGDLEYVSGHDALTQIGADFAAGRLSKDKRLSTPAWQVFRDALGRRDAQAVVDAARRLPSVRVELDTSRPRNPNFGLRVGWRYCCLFCAPVVEVKYRVQLSHWVDADGQCVVGAEDAGYNVGDYARTAGIALEHDSEIEAERARVAIEACPDAHGVRPVCVVEQVLP